MKSYARASPAGRLAFFLLGSHNLSMAAWGALQKGGTQLSVRFARRPREPRRCCRRLLPLFLASSRRLPSYRTLPTDPLL